MKRMSGAEDDDPDETTVSLGNTTTMYRSMSVVGSLTSGQIQGGGMNDSSGAGGGNNNTFALGASTHGSRWVGG